MSLPRREDSRGRAEPLTDCAPWRALAEHARECAPLHMREAFAADPRRFERFSLRLDDLLLDYSKNRVTARTVELLMELARARGLEEHRDAMFAGEPVNFTERRPALHVALRRPATEPLFVDGADVMPAVEAALHAMRDFGERVRDGEYRGSGGERIADVVHIGIGGSERGPAMACAALAPYARAGARVHFVSNADPAHLRNTLADLKPRATLFTVVSKSFTTRETLANATLARQWILEGIGDERGVARHFAAVTAAREEARRFGIDDERVFDLWDWVGGRFSLWSTVGLPIVLAVGYERFRQLLNGARAMDEHFLGAPLERNMPVILAMLGVWNQNFLGAQGHVVAPYDQNLAGLIGHLQQLEMESCGKGADRDGAVIDGFDTGTALWGLPGTDCQHAGFQMLHQGTRLMPVDFLIAARGHYPDERHHRLLVANCLAQSEALMLGRTPDETRERMQRAGLDRDRVDELAPHRSFPGNRPSNTLMYERLDPFTLGRIVALYEHKTFVQGVVWGIDPFDQWGVELGKQLAERIDSELGSGEIGTDRDASTRGLMRRYLDGHES